MPANLTRILEKGVDVSDQYVGLTDIDDVYNYLNLDGLNYYSPPGGLWTWGKNYYGQLGSNNLTHRTSPAQVGTATNWVTLGTSDPGSFYAIKSDGTLWAWGYNTTGELGLGNLIHRSSPTQVGSDTNWNQLSHGADYGIFALRTDGTLWAWGDNFQGQLGLGDSLDRSSPTQVGSLTDWKQISSGWFFGNVMGIKKDGTLWGWGGNSYGSIGLNDRTARSSPVQVGTDKNWKQISSGGFITAAIKTDGTLWTWGVNYNIANFSDVCGPLGLGDQIHRSSPTQVGSLTNWKKVYASSFTMAAVKTDGTLWAWGSNDTGQLGQNSIVGTSSPIQVGSLTNWKDVVVEHTTGVTTAAIKSDGTLWWFGYNDNNIFDQFASAHRSSPVQVGSLTSWKKILFSKYGGAIAAIK